MRRHRSHHPETAAPRLATARTRRRYDRIAPMYNMMEWGMEIGGFQHRRADLWGMVRGTRVLEVGVGTGKNIPHYPAGADVTAIDLSPRMLDRAQQLAERLNKSVDLRLMDAQRLEFEDDSFDAVVTTCVFCSVPDPVLGFRELKRVLRPGGQGYFLEHVLSHRPVLRQVMKGANPAVVRMMGANINRETRSNLRQASFAIEEERDLWLDILKLFVVSKSGST